MVTTQQAEAAAPIVAAINTINGIIAQVNNIIAINDNITSATLNLANSGVFQSAASLTVAETQEIANTWLTILNARLAALNSQLAGI